MKNGAFHKHVTICILYKMGKKIWDMHILKVERITINCNINNECLSIWIIKFPLYSKILYIYSWEHEEWILDKFHWRDGSYRLKLGWDSFLLRLINKQSLDYMPVFPPVCGQLWHASRQSGHPAISHCYLTQDDTHFFFLDGTYTLKMIHILGHLISNFFKSYTLSMKLW